MELKAAVCHEFGKPLSIETVVLAPPAVGEVLVRIKACSICHSDLSFAQGIWGGDLPAVYGHEAAGIIEAVGDGVTGWALGDRCIVTLIRHCGDCDYCRRDAEVLCDAAPVEKNGPLSFPDGSSLHQGMFCGAFAQACTVHTSQIAPLPDDISFELGALLACGVLTGYGSVRHVAGDLAGANVAIIGCGGVGLNALQTAALADPAVLAAIDPARVKWDMAQSFGATHVLDPMEPEFPVRVLELSNGRGFDHVIVSVGSPQALTSAQTLLAKAGKLIVVGMPPAGTQTLVDPVTLAAHSQTIVGTKMGNAHPQRDIANIITLYREGRLKLEELISGRYPLDDINRALAGLQDGSVIKNILVFE